MTGTKKKAKSPIRKKPVRKVAVKRKPTRARRAKIMDLRLTARKGASAARDSRREKVTILLLQGATYRQIASRLYCGLATVHRDVKALMKEWRTERIAKVDEVLVMQNRLLDQIQSKLMTKLLSPGKEEHDTIPLILALIDRRMKLYGLDAKAAVQHWKEILGPDESTRARNTDQSIAQGLRELETITRRHRGSDISEPSDRDDPGSKPLN